MNQWFQKQWVSLTAWHILLIPLSWVFFLVTTIRRYLYRNGWFKSERLVVPVIVVGNITVGGTGKTPFVIWLAEQLQLAGFTPGIISRGYGGKSKTATAVNPTSNPNEVGDEAVLIARRTNCPMFVGVNRASAGLALLKSNPKCNVIISDDGLQHYALQRDVEIALVNSDYGFGNQRLLPAGPLRENMTRLQTVNVIVDGGGVADTASEFKHSKQAVVCKMQVHGKGFTSLDNNQSMMQESYFAKKDLVAIAGIGNPERFFNVLSSLGLQYQQHVYPDHYAFTEQDLKQFSGKTILMTEKDAVKCFTFSISDAWYLPITATVNSTGPISLIQLILQKLRN